MDLQKNPDDALEFDELLKFVHQPTPAQFIKLNKFNKNSPYLPIEKVKWMLTMIFRQWHVEIISCTMQANSMVTIIRLHYLLPSGEWKYQDGVGAAPLQTDSGSAPSDLSKIKDNAVQLAAPKAESFAIKDAADKIGPIFGDSLKEILPFEPFKPDNELAVGGQIVSQPTPVQPQQIQQPVYHENNFPGWLWDGTKWVPDPTYPQHQQPVQNNQQQPLKF